MTKPRKEVTLALPDDGVLVRTERLVLALAQPEHAREQLAFELENRAHLQPWEPSRPAEYFTENYWRGVFERDRAELAADRSLRLTLFWTEARRPARAERLGPVLGGCRFSNFVRGSFHACHLGYRLDHRLEGKGYMSEALRGAIPFVFEELGFHRVMANYQPMNERSGLLLRKLGFSVEGYARDYLFLDGAWRDHVLTALTRADDGRGVRPWEDPHEPEGRIRTREGSNQGAAQSNAPTRAASGPKSKSRG